MATPPIDFQFKVGDKVAYKRDTYRKGTVIATLPTHNIVHVLWKVKTTVVNADELKLIERTNKPENKQIK